MPVYYYRKGKDNLIYAFKPFSREEFYDGVSVRLQNDVGTYISAMSSSGVKAGFFAIVRLLFPTIEAISLVENRTSQEVLSDLKFPRPYASWIMFRHALSHNDHPHFIKVGDHGKYIGWGISFGATHITELKHTIGDGVKLYEDLLGYVLEQKNIKPKEKVYVPVGRKISRKEKIFNKIVQELRRDGV